MNIERRHSDVRQAVSGLYTLGKTIGRGHFAVVKLAQHVFTGKEVAVKVIDKTKLDEKSKAVLFQEVMCMKLVQHANVVRLYEVIDTTTKLYLILELADGGDMYDYIMKHSNGLSEPLARRYFRQICRALKYCHEMKVCHRDLKPENLVFFERQGVVKLADFGFSNQFSPGTKLLTSCGSLAYSAPEILLCDPYDAPAVDIWSLGVVLFMLVTGRAPFQEANDSETVMMILDCSYKVPPNISFECQSLIHRMIVRDPEKRATLNEVVSDAWFRQSEEDDDDDQHEMDTLQSISADDHQAILRQMIDGNLAEQQAILTALHEDQYNHLTATYNLLAEKIFHEKIDDHRQSIKRQRRSLQPTTDTLNLSASASFNFADVSLPLTRRNSTDDELDDFTGKENLPTFNITPRHSLDLSHEFTATASIEDDGERSLLQQRTTNPTVTQPTPTQAMNIILEEDENTDSSPTDRTGVPLQQPANHPKLNKIVESEDEDDNKSSKSNLNVPIDNPSTTSGILRSKDLRIAVETKRRNFSRSCSSSDSEDTGSAQEMNHFPAQKPTFFHEGEPLINSRGRSLSSIEHYPHQTIATNPNDGSKRRSFSRTSSIVSANRLTSLNANDDINVETTQTNSLTLIQDRTRSLSVDHRLANYSQMSITSRTSIRYSTPRESKVFTKTDAPTVVQFLRQTHPHDATDAIKILIEHQRQQPSTTFHDPPLQPPIIIEEDTCPLLISSITTSPGKKLSSDIENSAVNPTTLSNGHISSDQRALFSCFKCSFRERQRRKLTSTSNAKDKHRPCCVIL